MMKRIFHRSAGAVLQDANSGGHPVPTPSCVDAPLVLASNDGRPRVVKIEAAVRLGDSAVVAGWSTGPLDVRVRGDHVNLEDARPTRFARPDVAAHFGLSTDDDHGWVFVVPCPETVTAVGLEIQERGAVLLEERVELAVGENLPPSNVSVLGPAFGLLALGHEPFSASWKELVRNLPCRESGTPAAHGYLEAAIRVRGTGVVVVVGWAFARPGSVLWIEDARGNAYPLAGACPVPRHDVYALHGDEFGAEALNSGFVALVRGDSEAGAFRLKALASDGVHVLSQAECTQVPPSPLGVSKWIFGSQVPAAVREQYFDAVSGPLLTELLARDRAHWSDMPVTRRDLGAQVLDPAVSIIVPLYGRFDFVENQMVEWAKDLWMRTHAELIYVLDDPAIVEAFSAHAEELNRLYGVSFSWVWGGVNRGFSGANNLGASVSRGEKLLFLNSDVFPQAAGWLETMVDALDSRPDVGAVGPRLTFAEGGIQHAGMRFEWMQEHGVWINRHPLLGLDPALDPASGPTRVPALTGACVLVRRSDFAEIGGWDTGYLVGDFEDSDLCLKLRERGLSSLYLPGVQLTHLERQSMTALGGDAFRMQVTLWNAMRHQRRWRTLIEQTVEFRA